MYLNKMAEKRSMTWAKRPCDMYDLPETRRVTGYRSIRVRSCDSVLMIHVEATEDIGLPGNVLLGVLISITQQLETKTAMCGELGKWSSRWPKGRSYGVGPILPKVGRHIAKVDQENLQLPLLSQ